MLLSQSYHENQIGHLCSLQEKVINTFRDCSDFNDSMWHTISIMNINDNQTSLYTAMNGENAERMG